MKIIKRRKEVQKAKPGIFIIDEAIYLVLGIFGIAGAFATGLATIPYTMPYW